MKKVQVLMSTYNGGKNIIRQVKTIINQIDVKVLITIRDDGSDCETKSILKSLSETHTEVNVIYGENIGYKKSFLELLGYVKDNIDYCAFSDQDDIWEKNKLINAVNKLDDFKSSDIKLYISSLDIFDKNLNFLKKKGYFKCT